MKELSDGTCRPCTTSEIAALRGKHSPTRSPSVNPRRSSRTPVRPAPSPLGRPASAVAPEAPDEERDASAHLQPIAEEPKQASFASPSPGKQGAQAPDEATAPSQHSKELCGNRDKENTARAGQPAGVAASTVHLCPCIVTLLVQQDCRYATGLDICSLLSLRLVLRCSMLACLPWSSHTMQVCQIYNVAQIQQRGEGA